MRVLHDTFTLPNGIAIPKIGFGTWQIPDGPTAYGAVRAALDAGYRHVDTARAYGNEVSVGRAVRDSGVRREEVFITTKLPAEIKGAAGARRAFEKSAAALDLGAVDLLLIHAPWPWDAVGSNHDAGNAEVWGVFEELYAAGRARAIGVSNFDVRHLETLRRTAEVAPHANQIQWYVGSTEPATTAYCRERGILVEGYSPLATGELLRDRRLKIIADRYAKTVAQLSIRYLIERDVLPLPKSVTPSRIAENADIDFSISAEDLAKLDAF